MTHAIDRETLRRQMRERRRAVPAQARSAAAARFAAIVSRAHLLRPGKRVALYMRHRSEADPSVIMQLARRRGCRIYLPVIGDVMRARMNFVRHDTGQPLRANRFGILEPQPSAHRRISARHLDIVFLPLLAVADDGSRLGSGLGYYDRSLHHLRAGRRWRRPLLIGVAYEFQRVASLAPARWDVPLDGFVTEKDFHRVRNLAGVPGAPKQLRGIA